MSTHENAENNFKSLTLQELRAKHREISSSDELPDSETLFHLWSATLNSIDLYDLTDATPISRRADKLLQAIEDDTEDYASYAPEHLKLEISQALSLFPVGMASFGTEDAIAKLGAVLYRLIARVRFLCDQTQTIVSDKAELEQELLNAYIPTITLEQLNGNRGQAPYLNDYSDDDIARYVNYHAYKYELFIAEKRNKLFISTMAIESLKTVLSSHLRLYRQNNH